MRTTGVNYPSELALYSLTERARCPFHAILWTAFDRPARTGPCPLPRLAIKTKEKVLKRIFVGNLDFDVTESGIRALFERYGAVARVNLVRDRETGRSRGFCFVEMSDFAQGEQAIRDLNGTELAGLALKVSEARPKTEGGPGGFRREGGGQRRGPRW